MSRLRAALERRSAISDAVDKGTYGVPGLGSWGGGMVWQPGTSPDSASSAARLSAVFGSWRLLTDAISTLPLDVFRVDGEARTPAPLPSWLRFVGESRIDYLAQLVLSLLTNGTAFIATPRDEVGVPTRLVVLDPTVIEVTTTAGQRTFRWDGQQFGTRDIQQINGMILPGALRGMSPVRYARDVIDGALSAQQYGTTFFDNAAVPPAVISVPSSPGAAQNQGVTDTERAQRIAEAWKSTHGGSSNAGKVGVLIGGAKLETISFSPEDAQWLDSRRFGVQEIARIYGIPPHLLADSSNSTSWGSGLAEQNLAFGQFSLRPWITRIEAGHEAILASAGLSDHRYRLNLDASLRAAPKDRYWVYQLGIMSQILTPNEARALEDLPPIEGGDVTVRQPFVDNDARDMTPVQLAGALQKIYLAVGNVISADEAREILNRAGADLTGPAPNGGAS